MKNNRLMKKRVLSSSISSSITLALFTLSFSQSVTGHGFTEVPKARQAICQAQGGYWWPDDGTGIPNLACKAAFLESGYVPFVQEHEISINVADYNSQAAVEAAVPDGTLCAAGSSTKSGLNLPSPDWQKSILKPNSDGKVQLRFNAQTPHNPSYWKIYLSKPSFNADTDVLNWADLDLIGEHGNLNYVNDPDGNRYYDMDITIPVDRSGNALLFTRWQRIDPAGEGFYNCSDITIEQDGVEPDEWQAVSYFVKQGQVAQVDESIWTRLFDENGQEIINHMFKITTDNLALWQSLLAEELVGTYSNDIQIGIKNGAGDITFDSNNLLTNQVWATNPDYTFQLSVQAIPDNTAPIVNALDDIELTGGQSVDIHLHAFDDENDPLTITWQAHSPLSYSGSNTDIQLTASTVEVDINATVSVDVSDGEFTTSQSFNVLVKASSNIQLWSASTAYQTGDEVSYGDNVYRAKWWNKNAQPDVSQAWELVDPDNGDSSIWSAEQAYSGGDEAMHNNVKYRAKWWTQGEEPGVADVWQAL